MLRWMYPNRVWIYLPRFTRPEKRDWSSCIGQQWPGDSGYGHFSANSFQAGGFDSLTLAGTVQFSGPVAIAANRLITVVGGVIFADASVSLSAPYVDLGTPFQAPQQAGQLQSPFHNGANLPAMFSPTYGPGNLTVEATSLIDIGALSLQNIGQANFIANGGDIRGDGTLEMAGALTLTRGPDLSAHRRELSPSRRLITI